MPLNLQAADQAAMAPATAPATKKKGIGPWPYAAVIGGNAADIGTTLAALSSGRGQEANPVLGGMNPAVMAGVKAGGTMAMLMGVHALAAKGHTKAAKVLAYTMASALGAIAAHNSQVGK